MDVSHTRLGAGLVNRLVKRKRGTYINPSLLQLATIVPSWMKSTPPTGSECAGRLRITRAPIAQKLFEWILMDKKNNNLFVEIRFSLVVDIDLWNSLPRGHCPFCDLIV